MMGKSIKQSINDASFAQLVKVLKTEVLLAKDNTAADPIGISTYQKAT